MNDNHERHLVGTFRYIDELLGEAVQILAVADSVSPFAKYTQDSSPLQRKVIDDYIRGIDQAMARIMAELDLPPPAPVCGALWAAQTGVSSARISVAEIRPQVMRGYGALSDVDVALVDGIVAELDAALERLMAYLAQGSDTDLLARLQKLEQTRDEVPLLRELERIITDNGLVGLRGTLSMLLDRMKGNDFEIGVFGRVSSGKSSLLNHLLGAAVLPVGVTPVTAVATRIRFGEVAGATIEFAQSPPITVGLERLPEFSAEQQNPGNRKHVTRIVVEVKAARLHQGITLVDTPGLGSLATGGAAETTAYLPRCDLGVVLVDAGATLTQEDQALVQLLLRSGAGAMVLVSKADLLEPVDRKRFVDYVQQQLANQFGTSLPVYPISVVGEHSAFCDAWFEQTLQPLLLAHREQAAASLKRKVGLLREAVSRTLEARLGSPSAGAAAVADPACLEAIAALRTGEGLCANAQHTIDTLADELPCLADTMIESAATEIAALWRQERTKPNVAAICAATLQRSTAAHTAEILRLLLEQSRQLEDVLRQARQCLGESAVDGEPLPSPYGMPLIDATVAVRGLDIFLPSWLSMLLASWLTRLVRARLHERWRGPLGDVLDNYHRSLRFWVRQAMAELRTGFQAHAASLMTQLEARTTVPDRHGSHVIDADLKRLREFGA